MSQTIYTEALARAVELEGSAQALAYLLRVPESTLERWMSGRAQMPLQAFLKLTSLILQHEGQMRSEMRPDLAPSAARVSPDGVVTLKVGPVMATCPRCDGTQFKLAQPDKPLRYVSELICCSCGQQVVHGNLVAQLAKDAVHQSRASIVRVRRRAQLLEKRIQQTSNDAPEKKLARED